MLFNSIAFLVFLPVVFIAYWFLTGRNTARQNLLLLLASYVFYGWWDWRFLFLLVFSTGLDYYTGLRIRDAATPRASRIWLWISVGANLGFLGFFKYYNFFIDSMTALLARVGLETNPWTLQIILPVGISFYTFHDRTGECIAAPDTGAHGMALASHLDARDEPGPAWLLQEGGGGRYARDPGGQHLQQP